MGRKVLQGLSKNLCQIFLGYQGYEDLPEIKQLGKGRYEIDILTTICKKDGIEIDSFNAAGKLQQWFFTQVEKEKIFLDEIRRAVLIVDVTHIEETQDMLPEYGLWKSTYFSFECLSYINAFNCEYTAQDSGSRELC
jgi:hypothetical protein